MTDNIRNIYGEYDPPYIINKNPTKEQIEAAKRLEAEYEKKIAKKKSK